MSPSQPAPDLVGRCAALGDDTRWSILVRLGRSPASASSLAAALPVSRQAVAKHLEVLRATGLVTSERSGREIVFRAVGAELSDLARALDTIARGWDVRLAALKAAAEGPD